MAITFILLVLASAVSAMYDDPPARNAVPQRPAPNAEFRAAYIEIGTKVMEQRKLWLAEKDEQRKHQIMKDMVHTMAEKLLPLARKYPESRESFMFLLECAAADHKEGIELLLQLHDKKSDLGDACINMAMQGLPLGDRCCAVVLEKSSNPENRGKACLGYGYWLQKQAEAAAEEGNLKKARPLNEQAKSRFAQAGREYGSITIDFGSKMGRQTIQSMADRALRELSQLAVGQTAPELTGIDLEGKSLSLKEHRGKVVMLSFWAHWCGPCMALVPHERELVERFKDKPFVLLGVNGDDPGKELLEKTKAVRISWRSYQNQSTDQASKISEAWNVMTWPTVYLIDQNGVIRRKWVGRVDPKIVGTAVEQLVEEAQKPVEKP